MAVNVLMCFWRYE